MRISDWSSDVCSSDLAVRCAFGLCSNGCLVALVVGFHIAPLCAEACAARSRRAVVRLLVGLDAHFARADLSPEARGLNGFYEASKGTDGIEDEPRLRLIDQVVIMGARPFIAYNRKRVL